MRFSKFLSICLMISIGCTFDESPTFYKIEPTLEIHVNSFFEEAGRRGVNISKENLLVILVDDLNYAGLSSTQGNQRVVKINRETVEHFNNHEATENLVFHELGHALLHKHHCHKCYSIMNPKMSLREYMNNPEKRKLLMDELFTPHIQQ